MSSSSESEYMGNPTSEVSGASKLRDSIKTYGSNSYYYAHSRSAEFVVPENAKIFEGPGIITGGAPVKISVGEPVLSLERPRRKIEKYSWCDEDDKVCIYIDDTNVTPHITETSVSCHFGTRSVSVTVMTSDLQHDFSLEIPELCEEIQSENSHFKVSTGKRITVKLVKLKASSKWHSLKRKFPTVPIEGQKTGTSGLRRKVALVKNTPHYIENWLQSLVNALPSLSGKTMVLGGDGRYMNDAAAVSAIEIFAANGLDRIIIGAGGLMSTPACSALIRARKAFGGVIMTASHNPAGPNGDWGIKSNASNGEPAPEKVTDLIYAETQKISEIVRADLGLSPGAFARPSIKEFEIEGKRFVLEVVDPVENYLSLLKEIFDFEKLKTFVALPDFSLRFDGMHAVTGVYADRIFCQELGLDKESLQNCAPSPDFNGGHPDPNMVYAKDLVDRMKECGDEKICLGAASDGDGDRNMIMGSAGWFVTPSDSLAIIADYAESAIPYFTKNKLIGVARSMPTSRAVDAVCERLKIRCYETPTGWKYFGNLMDAHLANLCGEESFGTGADHIREKDGIWAVLAWLSILASANGTLNVRQINEKHWDQYGRHLYCRCDYEEVEADGANAMMDALRTKLPTLHLRELRPDFVVESANEYSYVDPVDGSIANRQGMVVAFTNKSRIMFRLSGTGSAGATVRIYIEQFVADWRNHSQSAESGPLMQIALDLSQIEKFTHRTGPTVIT